MNKKFAYKTQYQKENLKRIYIDVKKEIGEEFDKLLKENNQTRSEILLPIVKKYIENSTKK